MDKKRTMYKFIRTHADRAAQDAAQLLLYVTICKLLKPELDKLRLKTKS